jgi:branched-chain amino acid transport system substrate-binding protein
MSGMGGTMKRRTLSWFIPIITIFLLLAPMSGNTRGANAEEKQPATSPASTIKLAILAPLTGPSFLGIPARDGALLAIEQQNARGGILGMTIDPVIEDTACNAGLATTATNKVISQDGAHYIIGDMCSGSSIPMSEITNAAGVIQMTPTATNPLVTVGSDGQVKEYVFRASFIDPFQGVAAARFVRSALSAQKAFIMLNSKSSYSQGLADAFQAEFSRSGTIAGKAVYEWADPPQNTDFSAILDQIAAADPDIVYLPDYYDIVNLVTQQAEARGGITMPFIGGDGWDHPDLDTAAASGGYFINHMSYEDPRPEVSAFIQAFTDRYGYPPPHTSAALAYDAANLLFQAMQEAGTADTAVVKTKLAAIAFQGVSGTLFYDQSHNAVKSAVVMSVQTGGVHFYALIPPNRPAADLTINYNSGSPGSAFTVAGANFPPNSTGTITINGHVVGTITVDGVGGFVFQLNTTNAGEGLYSVAVTVNPGATAYLAPIAVNPSAATRFMLDDTAPLRSVEGDGPVIAVPGGIAYTKFIYLPLVRR